MSDYNYIRTRVFRNREPPGKTEQKAEEAAKVEHVESDKVTEQKEKQQEQSLKDKEVSKTEANVETKEQKKVEETVDQPKDTEIEVREQAAETNEEAKQESTTPKTETKIAEVVRYLNKRTFSSLCHQNLETLICRCYSAF